MEDEFEVSPVGADDMLVNLGLVDVSTGRALPTDDWSPTAPAAGARSATATREVGDELEGDEDEGDDGEPQATEVQQTPSRQVQQSKAPNWDSDENPFKKQYEELQTRLGAAPDPVVQARQTFDQQVQVLGAQRDAAYQTLITQGLNGQAVPPAMAKVATDALYERFVGEARSTAERAALLPVAKQTVANDIAKKHSVGKVVIKPEELMGEPTQEAMTARARTLAETRRDGAFQARKTSRRDRAEGAGGAPTVPAGAMDDLSPSARISLGLRRGQLRDSI